ncbi:MAG: phosphotransferase family protein [Actinobacteria bacterium]|nr:phosphotransferase family protein [Actinomycetota bacterium]
MSDIPGVDLAVLATWMDVHALGAGPIETPTLIAGGTQNVLLRFTRAGREFVLRRPPVHKRVNSDETMRREARVLAAIAGTDVPHPGLIASEPDPEVLGASFYLMEPVDGFNATLGLPEPHATDPTWQREMGLSMADAIAALSRVDHVAVGLGDLGRFEGWAERQVGRWRKQLDSYSELPGYPGPDLPGVDRVGEWLEANRPTDVRAGVMHGDFHFANVLMRYDRPALAAIVDWELVTIGDPLLDLGHLLATWPAADGPGVTLQASGLPTHDEVIARYAAASGRPLDELPWYRVLACYRLGLILEGTHARACAGMAPKEIGDQLHAHTVALLEQALGLIA